MQCPKCNAELESEVDLDKGKCSSCGVYFHKIRSRPLSESLQPPRSSKAAWRVWGGAVVAIVLLVGGGFWGIGAYQRMELVSQAEAKMRMANGLVAELLDNTAMLTTAGYLQKAPGRIRDLDSLVTASLAIDDEAIPGLAGATAEYVKGARNFIHAQTAFVHADLKRSVAEAGYNALADFAESSEGRVALATSDSLLMSEAMRTLDQAREEKDAQRKTALIKESVDQQNLIERRRKYLESEADLALATEQRQEALETLNRYGLHIDNLGKRVSTLAGRRMPTQVWHVPRT